MKMLLGLILLSFTTSAYAQPSKDLNSAMTTYLTTIGLDANKVNELVKKSREVSVSTMSLGSDVSCQFQVQIKKEIFDLLGAEIITYEGATYDKDLKQWVGWENWNSVKLQDSGNFPLTFTAELLDGSGDVDLITAESKYEKESYKRLYIKETDPFNNLTLGRISLRYENNELTAMQLVSNARTTGVAQTRWCEVGEIEIRANAQKQNLEDFLLKK
jgi:hypothetical protein